MANSDALACWQKTAVRYTKCVELFQLPADTRLGEDRIILVYQLSITFLVSEGEFQV
jgi:hypothetical protein